MSYVGSTRHLAFDLSPRLNFTRVKLDLRPELFLEGPLERLTFWPLATSRAIWTEWYEQKLHDTVFQPGKCYRTGIFSAWWQNRNIYIYSLGKFGTYCDLFYHIKRVRSMLMSQMSTWVAQFQKKFQDFLCKRSFLCVNPWSLVWKPWILHFKPIKWLLAS